MRYSKFQYFFWLISGSEIPVLKECENEYNRHANIGMMILITSLFAFCTAFIAGLTFVKDNLTAVIFFALVWALLIFAIDRSMVNSIKRDPEATIQPFWSFFIPRFILALILAFFMSIPLDHVVFPEAIKRQMKENVHRDWLKRQQELTQGYNVSNRDSGLQTMQTEINVLNSALESECPLVTYQEAKANYDNCTQEAAVLERTYESKKTETANYLSQLPINPKTRRRIINPAYVAKQRARDEAYRAWKDKETQCGGYYQEAKRIDSEWRKTKQEELNTISSRRAESLNNLDADKKQIEDDSRKIKEELEAMTGFDTKFTTLFLMPDWGVQVLKWAIFLALLVIEILPTYLKLKTPIGQYDIKMQEREDIMKNDVRERVFSEKEITKQTEKHRVNKEVELNNTIIDGIASVELNLAQETLIEWEQRARAQMRENVNAAANNT